MDIYGRQERLDTWINGTLNTIDLDHVWLKTFSHWEVQCLVEYLRTWLDTEDACAQAVGY